MPDQITDEDPGVLAAYVEAFDAISAVHAEDDDTLTRIITTTPDLPLLAACLATLASEAADQLGHLPERWSEVRAILAHQAPAPAAR